MDKKLHEGHRQRVKTRYLTEGLEAFEDHQVLEMLLFYCIPMRDTNELAHKMIKEFGSLAKRYLKGNGETSLFLTVRQRLVSTLSLSLLVGPMRHFL